MRKSQTIREDRAKVWNEMLAVEAAAEERGGMNGEDKGQWDKLEGRLDELSQELDRAERKERHESVDYSGVIDGRGGKTTDEQRKADEVVDDEGNTRGDYAIAFDLWARHGNGDLSVEQRKILREGFTSMKELRAQGVATGAAGGYTVPDLFRNKLIEVVKDFSGVRQVAEHIQTDTGADLPWPTNDDTGNEGAILGENTQDTENDLTFDTDMLEVFMYTSKIVRVSFQLLQDSALDLNSFLPRKLGERIGRVQNRHFTVGLGDGSQPQGIVVGATSVAAAAGSVSSFTYEDYVDATLRIDPAFVGNLRWMMSQAALGTVRKLKDGNGVPLWQPSLQAGAPDLFLGHGIVLNNHMPVPAANAKSVAFGDFQQGYVVRDVTGVNVLRLEERYADFLQVGFLAFQRSGGKVQDTQAITVMQNAAA